MTNNNNNKVWLITGTSSGLGLSLVIKLVTNGHKVAALSRSPVEIEKQIPDAFKDNLLAIATDITSESSVKEAVEKTVSRFGKIDILVNNSGYAFLGAVEESDVNDFKANYEVNVFAALNLIKYVTPVLRKQGYGLILNVASYLGFTPTSIPNYTSYVSSKYALNGLSQGLDVELKPHGIRSVLVSPGGFRTKFITGGLKSPKDDQLIPEYKTNDLKQFFNSVAGKKEAGNPDKAADAFIEISKRDLSTLPSNFFFGSDTYSIMKKYIEDLSKDLEASKDLAFSTDFDK